MIIAQEKVPHSIIEAIREYGEAENIHGASTEGHDGPCADNCRQKYAALVDIIAAWLESIAVRQRWRTSHDRR